MQTKWVDLTEKKKQLWLSSWKPNGCWAKGGWLKPPYAMFFEASCNIHDWSYEYGKNESDRKEADEGLLKYMKQDVKKIECTIKRIYYYSWCYLYYFALRIRGKSAFYRNKQK